ncbi:methionine adenosyltransferase [archaeon]|jgi:S-adenosylmethionine synthetase|nr:methionine adenosyltransferase [archaeon]MBT4396685.1 methionine adenosyltransferase [archaeon]MBT4441295.1 methionine adenosyltransferase [archaeon]
MVKTVIEPLRKTPENIEFVETKGFGHPDTLCDNICEKAAQAISKYYLKNFKRVLHFNIDKGIIIAGQTQPEFQAGKIIEPIKIIIAGRATTQIGNIKLPISEIIKEAVKKYLKPFELIYELSIEIREGATNLKEVEKHQIANDTSFGVAHYPLTHLENLTLKISRHINSDRFRRKYKAVGLDTKVMGLREGVKTSFTISIAFVAEYLKNLRYYKQLKQHIKDELEKEFNTKIYLNTLDGNSLNSCYITVTGFSCENGDDGQVGRGNRYNHLITPGQPMSLEATAGKNIFHPGKTYQIMAHIIARDLVKQCKLERVNVKILSQIGSPLTKPQIVSIQVQGKLNLPKIEKVVNKNFVNIAKFQKDIIFS